MRIFVDAMGGDLAPQAPVEGTVEALRRNPELTVTLAGIVPEIEKYLAGADDVRSRITLLDAPEVITNHESPVMGVRKKTKSATVLGMLAVRDKEADGFVSAGSTGAVLAGGMFRLGRIPGVERPALAPLMPNGKGYFLLIDCGANVDCKPEYLTQFGVMGDAYMRGVMAPNTFSTAVAMQNQGVRRRSATWKPSLAAWPVRSPRSASTAAAVISRSCWKTGNMSAAQRGVSSMRRRR